MGQFLAAPTAWWLNDGSSVIYTIGYFSTGFRSTFLTSSSHLPSGFFIGRIVQTGLPSTLIVIRFPCFIRVLKDILLPVLVFYLNLPVSHPNAVVRIDRSPATFF